MNSHQKVWEKKGFKTTRGLGFSFEEDDFPEPPEFGGDGDEAEKIMRSGLAFQIEAPGQAGRQIHSRASDGPGDPSPAKRFLYIKLESAGTDGVGEMIEHSLDYLRTRCYFGTKGDCVIPATLDEPAPCPMQGLEKNGRKEKYWGPLGKTVPGSQDRVKMCSDPDKYLQIPEFPSEPSNRVDRLRHEAQKDYCIWHRMGCEVTYVPLVDQHLGTWVKTILDQAAD